MIGKVCTIVLFAVIMICGCNRSARTNDDRMDIIQSIYNDVQKGKIISSKHVEQLLGQPSESKIINRGMERRLYLHKGDEHGMVIFIDQSSGRLIEVSIITPYSAGSVGSQKDVTPENDNAK